MKTSPRLLCLLLLSCSTGLTGCYKTVHIVQQSQLPDIYRTASVEQLEKEVADRDAALQSLNATVELTASTGSGRVGKVTEYTSLSGFIFVRKPGDLRVILKVPVLGSRAVDMVSDGTKFTLVINTLASHRTIVGTNTVTRPSKNSLENLRPPVFFDSLLVPGLKPSESVERTESTRLLQPEKRGKPLIEEPDYDLAISVPTEGSAKIRQTRRVLHINRVTMLPFQQDIYDSNGRVVTSATYDKYQLFSGQQFPTEITIRRPLDEYSLKIVITKLELNGKFEPDQFELPIPDGVKVEHME